MSVSLNILVTFLTKGLKYVNGVHFCFSCFLSFVPILFCSSFFLSFFIESLGNPVHCHSTYAIPFFSFPSLFIGSVFSLFM